MEDGHTEESQQWKPAGRSSRDPEEDSRGDRELVGVTLDQVRRSGKDIPGTGNSISQGTEAAWGVATAGEREVRRGPWGKTSLL